MKVLGIDTILHDVCVAVTDNNQVLSNEKRSASMSEAADNLLNLTAKHVRDIGEVIEQALQKAGISLEEIELIAVNNSGSLLSNVLIGLVAGNMLARIQDIPIVDVAHQEGHIFSNWIERDQREFNYPILVFSASGGHHLTALISKKNFQFKTISETMGIKLESKTAPKFSGIGYLFSQIIIELDLLSSPERVNGDGRFIAQLAKTGDIKRFCLLCDKQSEIACLDTSLEQLMKNSRKVIKKAKSWGRKLSEKFIFDFAASFEDSLARIIVGNLYFFANVYNVKEIHLAGGVSANEAIRNKLREKLKTTEIICRHPVSNVFCTDNAAMIATLGYYKFTQDSEKYAKTRCVDIKSDLVLERLAINQLMRQNKKLG